jgi:hypothetical protein
MRAAKAAGCILLTIAATGAAAVQAHATRAHAAAPAVTDCGSATVGPTAIGGKSGGALCLWHAYRSNCQPAVYRLSRFGIDTIARDTFRLVRARGHCRIAVTASFSVVPQKPHPVGSGRCSALVRVGTDVVAKRCVGKGLPASISLDGAR